MVGSVLELRGKLYSRMSNLHSVNYIILYFQLRLPRIGIVHQRLQQTHPLAWPDRLVTTRLYSKIILYIASFSITALLLPNSYTTYSHFQIPLNLYKESTYNISKSLNLAKLLRYNSLLIQDKVLIQHRYHFKAIYYILTDIYFNNSTFSRLPTILGGNFTQILPIILQGNYAAIIGACLQWLFLQPTFYTLSLQLNIYIYQGKINQRFIAQV